MAKEGTWQSTIVFHEGDDMLLQFIQKQMGVSRADALRTALRAYAYHLQVVTKLTTTTSDG